MKTTEQIEISMTAKIVQEAAGVINGQKVRRGLAFVGSTLMSYVVSGRNKMKSAEISLEESIHWMSRTNAAARLSEGAVQVTNGSAFADWIAEIAGSR